MEEKTKEKILNSEALEIISRLNMTLKIAKIYEPNNLIFLSQSQALYNLIQNVIKAYGECNFLLSLSSLFLNGVKVRFIFSNYNLFKFIASEFKRREINQLNFKKGLDEEELKRFILVFSKKETPQNPYQELKENLKKNDIKNILVEKIPSHELFQSDERYATKVFFLSIMHLKEMFETLKKKEKVPLNTTRRLMQSIFNHISHNESFVYGLTTIKNYDEYTLNHSVNVSILSIALGKRLGLDRNELADLGICAFFHDYGKTEIPIEILLKPDKLDEKEREIIEKHPHLGAEKLAHFREFSHLPLPALHVALEHHLKEDLSGYPRLQWRKDINLFSKIVKICDFFDALTTKRPYREKVYTREETLKMMLKMSGKEFDPIILKVFINMMGTYPVGTLVLLDTGEVGVVFEINMDPAFILRPKIKIIADEKGKKIDGEIVDLTEFDAQKNVYKRTIVKTLNPYEYEVEVSDYFLAHIQ